MEELKILVDMVAHLPQMALWVLVGFLIYKLAIVGSIYGTIRFAVEQFVKWRTFTPPLRQGEFRIGNIAINEDVERVLIAQIARLSEPGFGYIHMTDTVKLKQALDNVLGTGESK